MVVAVKIGSLFFLGSVALLVAAVELLVAVDLIVTGMPAAYGNAALGFAYCALLAVVGFRASRSERRSGSWVWELLALGAVALPFTLAAFAM